ncbi:nuclear transport factor 2 family protein [Azotobacter chroococcum]
MTMNTAEQLLHLHFETFVNDHERWKTLIADDLVWELPFAPALGHPARLSGRDQVLNHVGWFVGAVENFRFHDLKVHPGAAPSEASAEVKAEGLIKPTGRLYQQDYVLFVRVENGKLAFIREYFDPVRAAIALDAPIPALAS